MYSFTFLQLLHLTVQVVQAVDETQEAIADIPVREPPPPPRHTSPHFHASVQYFLTEVQGARRQVSGPMLVAFQPLNRRDVQRESKRIAAAAREYFNVMSQRGMFKMQLQVCHITVLACQYIKYTMLSCTWHALYDWLAHAVHHELSHCRYDHMNGVLHCK